VEQRVALPDTGSSASDFMVSAGGNDVVSPLLLCAAAELWYKFPAITFEMIFNAKAE
jgi:hypothetical protein